MRLSYMTRSINYWFSRVVYERDEWDERLTNMARQFDIRVGVILYVTIFLVMLPAKSYGS